MGGGAREGGGAYPLPGCQDEDGGRGREGGSGARSDRGTSRNIPESMRSSHLCSLRGKALGARLLFLPSGAVSGLQGFLV